MRQALQDVVASFAAGYNRILSRSTDSLDFAEVSPHLRGFAFEGAAMSATLLDLLTLSGGRRLRHLASGEGRRYIHLIHVGAGWAFARLRLRPWTGIRFAEPLLRWLAWDGWGFHQGFFFPQRVFVQQRVERRARGPVSGIRDQGVGRALWFYAGADPARIANVIAAFPASRRPDLCAGVGLAASYTGVLSPTALEPLVEAYAEYRDHIAQGSAFAAKAHLASGAVPARCAEVIEFLTGADPTTAAAWTDSTLAVALRGADSPHAYELWRVEIRRAWQREKGGVEL